MCRYLFVRCDNEPAPWATTGVCRLFAAAVVCQCLTSACVILHRSRRQAAARAGGEGDHRRHGSLSVQGTEVVGL